ncbi:hypothetical protein H0H93_007662, partial [Arthromyces matolae]
MTVAYRNEIPSIQPNGSGSSPAQETFEDFWRSIQPSAKPEKMGSASVFGPQLPPAWLTGTVNKQPEVLLS